MKFRLLEQAVASGGSFAFLMVLPLFFSVDELALFYLIYAFATTLNGVTHLYLVFPIVSGGDWSKYSVIKKISISTSISFLLSVSFFYFRGDDYSIRWVDLTCVVFFPAVVSLIEIIRILSARSAQRSILFTASNGGRWMLAFFQAIFLEIEPFQSLMLSNILLLLFLLISPCRVGMDHLQKGVGSNIDRQDLFYAFASFLFSCSVIWVISMASTMLLAQYYAARNMLNVSNTLVQFVEVHLFNGDVEWRLKIKRFMSSYTVVGLFGVLFVSFSTMLITLYFNKIDNFEVNIGLIVIVAVTVFFQSYNRLLTLIVRSNGQHPDSLLCAYAFVAVLCALSTSVIETARSQVIFFLPLLGYVVICLMLEIGRSRCLARN